MLKFSVLEVKFSIYLNRCVFVMSIVKEFIHTQQNNLRSSSFIFPLIITKIMQNQPSVE